MKKFLWASLMAICGAILPSNAQNPIVQTCYTADPAPMVDGDRLYVYIDRDEGPDWYVMNEWRVYSTADMVNWTDHGAALPLSTFKWAKAGTAWASQCIKSPVNNKYYWYVCCEQTTGGMALGVAESDSPTGPFKDALNRPLIKGGWGYIDPSPFIDDDGTPYLVFGNPGCFIAKLNRDMVSYDTSWTVYGNHVRKEQDGIWEFYQDENSFGGPKDIPEGKENSDYKDLYEEGPWLTKRGNMYYLMYAAGGVPEHISYSSSSSPTGPWTYRGQIMRQQNTGSFTNHAGLCTFKGHDYFFYHTGWLPGGSGFKRAMAVEEFKYNSDGTIPEITATRQGVTPIGTLNPFIRQEAETMATSSGIKSNEVDGQNSKTIYITDIQNGDFVKVRNLDFNKNVTSITLSVSSNMNGGKIIISSAQDGGITYGEVQIPNTSGDLNWREITVELSNGSALSGVKDIYFRFSGTTSGNICNVDWWRFNSSSIIGSTPIKPFKNAWTADNGDGTFTNPIINADGPDIDVIRVGDTYYMVTTTMFVFPGATIFKSKDLVNWEYCCNPLKYIDNNDAYNLQNDKNHYSQGQWASSLKYHDGKFYLYFISYGREGVDSGRNVLLTTTNPEGEWKMEYMNEHYYDSGWMFDDGPNGDGYLYVACGIGNIHVNKLDPKTLRNLGSTQVIWNKDGYEGAHMYHIGNYYYLYLTTGGYWRGQTIYRSTNPMGPYTECPNGNVEAGSVFSGQGIHQGGLVETQTGEWWTIMFKDAGAIGRVPYLEPVRWVDGWPIIGDNGTDVSKDSRKWKKPNVGKDYPATYLPTNDPFVDSKLGMQWGWNHNPDDRAWSLSSRPGWLRLTSCSVTNTVTQARNMLTQRIMSYDPEGTTWWSMKDSYGTAKFDVSGMKDGDVCGLCVFQDNHGYIGVKMDNGKKYFVQYINNFSGTIKKEVVGAQLTSDIVYLRAVCNFGSSKANFYYSLDNATFTKLGNELTMNYTLTVFTGNRFGLFNYSTRSTGGHVDIDWFTTEDGAFNEAEYYGMSGDYNEQGTQIGNSKYDAATGRYIYYTPTYSSFIFKKYDGTPLDDCADFTIALGDHTIGYRLDVQLKDAAGNIIKNDNEDYIIGNADAGTRITDVAEASNKIFDLRTLFANYLTQYPGCKIGEIRLNTVVDSEDTNREGKYYITIDKMEMNISQVEARKALHATLADIPMYRYEDIKDYVFNNPDGLFAWGNVEFNNLGDGAYELIISEKKASWEGQFNIGDQDYINGQEYILSLDIKGSVDGTLSTGIQNPDGYKDCGNFGDIPVTTEWQTITKIATVNGEGARRVLLNVGDYVGTLNISNVQLYSISGQSKTEITGTNISLNEEKSNGGEFFGAGLATHVNNNEYADLTGYDKMIIKGTGDEIRILYNRPDMNSCPEIRKSLNYGSITIDLTEYPYFHLNSIKAAWGQTANVESILLVKGDDPEGFADYYITGAGRVSQSATDALADTKATSIDITGMTNKFPMRVESANPNCLLIYRDGAEDLMGGAFDARNVVKKSNDYSAWRLDLFDTYDFSNPINSINCVGGASLSCSREEDWNTAVLPFDINVATCGVEIYKFKTVTDGTVILEPVTSGTIAANTPFIYKGSETRKFSTNERIDLIKSPDGYNIQAMNENGWSTAMSYIEKSVNTANLSDYNVYIISEGKLILAPSSFTMKPFTACFLQTKSGTAAVASRNIIIDNKYDINDDGVITLEDVVLLISHLNGSTKYQGKYNVSKASKLSVSDVSIIANIVINKQ